MRPAVPEPGDLATAAWLAEVVDYIGAGWRYVPNPAGAAIVSRTPYPTNTTRDLELTEVPANDPTIRALVIGAMIRETTTSSATLTVKTADGVDCGLVGTQGVASRGGPSPALLVPPGGVNRRSIKVTGSGSTTATWWLWVQGWWVAESDEPAAGSMAPIVSERVPIDPGPGDELVVDWAADLLALAGRSWRFHHLALVTGPLWTAAGTYTWDLAALLPADANVVAAAILLRLRGSDTNSRSLYVKDADGSFAGAGWTAGSAAKYATTGPWIVRLGGGRSVTCELSGAVQDAVAQLAGYWTADGELDA
jgi:hypothetical protein